MAKQSETSSRLWLRRDALRATLGAAVFMPALVKAQSSEKVGSVEEVKGEAFGEVRDRRRTLERAAPLFLNEVVGASARLTIDRFLVNAGGDITLQSGPILFDRPEGAPPQMTRINSAFGLIAVRGTRFFAGPSNGVFGVFVMRGSVEVASAGSEVTVTPGQGTNIARPGDTPTAPAPWGDPRIGAAMQSVM
jgi:ferric-dicitrate binding protein FerR (iron transport regulator)